jgi:hypothetical protein
MTPSAEAPRTRTPPRVLLLFAVAHAITSAVFLFDRSSGTRAALFGLPLDDGFIHLVYARSLSRFSGLEFNPGQPETGFTSPLWAVVEAPLFWLQPLWGGSVVLCVKALGVFLGWCASVFAYRLVRRLTPQRGAAPIAGMLIALDPSLTFAKLSGMEVALAVAVVLWTLASVADDRRVSASIGLALAPLARPELGVFVALIAGVLAVRLHRERAEPRRWALAFLPAILGVGLWCLYCWSVTGRPLPSTFYAKHGAGGIRLPELELLFGPMLSDLPWFHAGSGFALFAAGALLLLRGDAVPTPEGTPKVLRAAIVALPVAFMLGLAWAHSFTQGLPFYWNRYFQPAIAMWLVPIAVAVGWIGSCAERVLRDPSRSPRLLAGAAVGILACLLPCAALPRAMRGKARLYSNNCENIDEMQVELARWVAARTRPGEWIASGDAGALRFVSDRPLVDLVGLNNHEVLAGGRAEVLARTRPRFYVVFPSWERELANSPSVRVAHRVRAKRYTICDCDQEEMVVLQPLPPPARSSPGER